MLFGRQINCQMKNRQVIKDYIPNYRRFSIFFNNLHRVDLAVAVLSDNQRLSEPDLKNFLESQDLPPIFAPQGYSENSYRLDNEAAEMRKFPDPSHILV